ncbi:MAG: hypothetical protein B6244_02170 [Candidatus Cloacimonetes bacterium 4572_55]|nr:MAG: hypothetical protein B6244_02170 [Candidatus Cloacimonetes bacterium 4572_55]
MPLLSESTTLWLKYRAKKFFKRLFSLLPFVKPSEVKAPSTSSRKKKGKKRRLFRQHLVAGILVIIPIFLTYLLLRLLFDVLDGFVSPYVHRLIHVYFPIEWKIPGVGLASMVLVIYFTGLLASNVLGKRVVELGELVITRLPVVKNIYQAAKQLTLAIAMQDKKSFQRVVFVEYPKSDSYAIAFVTKDLVDQNNQEMVTAFLPTTPNPTSGFILVIPKSKVIPAGLTVEEGIKLVMSGGLVAEEMLNAAFPVPEIPLGRLILEAKMRRNLEESGAVVGRRPFGRL